MLPKYIAARHIALALGPEWRTQRVSRILTAMGIARKLGKARGVFVTPEDLAGAWPEMFEGVLEKLEDIEPVQEKRRYHVRGEKKTNSKAVSNQTRVKTDTNVCTHMWECGYCDRCGIQRPNNNDTSCEYEVGAGWSCRHSGCDNPDHR